MFIPQKRHFFPLLTVVFGTLIQFILLPTTFSLCAIVTSKTILQSCAVPFTMLMSMGPYVAILIALGFLQHVICPKLSRRSIAWLPWRLLIVEMIAVTIAVLIS